MGHTARKRRSEERKKRKRAMKAQKREQYAALAGTGRRASRVKSVQPGAFSHETTSCGNPGCIKCFTRPAFLRSISELDVPAF